MGGGKEALAANFGSVWMSWHFSLCMLRTDRKPVLSDNIAHMKIIGEKGAEVRLKFVDISGWAMPPETKSQK